MRGGLGGNELLVQELRTAEAQFSGFKSLLEEFHASAAAARLGAEEAEEERGRELAAEEEAAAAQCRSDNQEDDLRQAVRSAEARCLAVEQAMVSDLYWRWRRSFEAHLRAGRWFEDFPLEDFILDFSDAVPVEKLRLSQQSCQRFVEEREGLERQVAQTQTEEAKLCREVSAVRQTMRDLQFVARETATTNFAWWEDRLKDTPNECESRLALSRLNLQSDELERECLAWEECAADYSGLALRQRREAAQVREETGPCQREVVVVERSAQDELNLEERVQQRVDRQRYELGQFGQLRVLDFNTRRLSAFGQEMQHRALSLLQEAAKDRATQDGEECNLELLREALQKKQLEASAVNNVLRGTEGALQRVSTDLQGLRLAHEEMRAERDRTAQLLLVARSIDKASPRLRQRLAGDPCSAADSDGLGRGRAAAGCAAAEDPRAEALAARGLDLGELGRAAVPRPLPLRPSASGAAAPASPAAPSRLAL